MLVRHLTGGNHCSPQYTLRITTRTRKQEGSHSNMLFSINAVQNVLGLLSALFLPKYLEKGNNCSSQSGFLTITSASNKLRGKLCLDAQSPGPGYWLTKCLILEGKGNICHVYAITVEPICLVCGTMDGMKNQPKSCSLQPDLQHAGKSKLLFKNKNKKEGKRVLSSLNYHWPGNFQ